MNEETIEKLKQGDEDAFKQVYLEYANKLCAYIDSLIHNHFDAQDVTQDVFLYLFESIKGYDSKKGSFQVWLYSIARNSAYSYLRIKNKLEPTDNFDDLVAEDTISDIITIQDLIHILSAEEYTILVYKFYYSYTNKEIAEKLKTSLSTVKRALTVIYKVLKKYSKD